MQKVPGISKYLFIYCIYIPSFPQGAQSGIFGSPSPHLIPIIHWEAVTGPRPPGKLQGWVRIWTFISQVSYPPLYNTGFLAGLGETPVWNSSELLPAQLVQIINGPVVSDSAHSSFLWFLIWVYKIMNSVKKDVCPCLVLLMSCLFRVTQTFVVIQDL